MPGGATLTLRPFPCWAGKARHRILPARRIGQKPGRPPMGCRAGRPGGCGCRCHLTAPPTARTRRPRLTSGPARPPPVGRPSPSASARGPGAYRAEQLILLIKLPRGRLEQTHGKEIGFFGASKLVRANHNHGLFEGVEITLTDLVVECTVLEDNRGKEEFFGTFLAPLLAKVCGDDNQKMPGTLGPLLGPKNTGLNGLAQTDFVGKDGTL